MSDGRLQRGDRVVERRSGASTPAQQTRRGAPTARARRTSEAAREAFRLRCARFDQEALAKKTYLTIPEFCAYGCFESENAAYLFLGRHVHKVPKCRRGRTVLVMRRDYDRFVQASRSERAHG